MGTSPHRRIKGRTQRSKGYTVNKMMKHELYAERMRKGFREEAKRMM